MPFAPSDISGLKIWLKADAGAGSSDSDPVGTWTDQSGTSHNFTQATSGKKPLYRTGKRNGLPAVVFDGTDDQLDGGDLSAVFTSAATMFMAVNNIPGGGGKMMAWESKNNDAWWVFTGNAGYWGLFRATRLANTPGSGLNPSGWSIWALTADNGSNYKVWQDNVLVINDTGGFTFDGGNEHILAYQKTNNEYKNMELGELVAFDSVLSGTDLTSMYNYMNGRWGSVSATATPSATAGTGAVPASTASGQAKGAPSTTAGTGAVPAPTASGAAIAAPGVVAGVGAVPAPSAVGTSAGTAAAPTVTGAGAVPPPTTFGAAKSLPAVTAGTGAVPAPTGTGVALVSPSKVAGIGAVPTATAFGQQNATVTPSTVAGIGRVPHPHAVGQGTGGGGGSVNGVTDFWAVKALG